MCHTVEAGSNPAGRSNARCEQCGQEHNGGFGAGRFCGKSCKVQYCAVVGQRARAKRKHDRAIAAYTANEQQCVMCGATIPYIKRANKFCDHSCAAKWTNRHFTRRRYGPSPKTYRVCKKCGAEFERSVEIPYTKNCPGCRQPRRACSRAKLIRERGHRCEQCGITTWQGKPAPLQLDHIDGNPDNWAQSNVRLLCPNCHAQTPTWGVRNRGRFPQARRNMVRTAWRQRAKCT